jgi:hypothetical protein
VGSDGITKGRKGVATHSIVIGLFVFGLTLGQGYDFQQIFTQRRILRSLDSESALHPNEIVGLKRFALFLPLSFEGFEADDGTDARHGDVVTLCELVDGYFLVDGLDAGSGRGSHFSTKGFEDGFFQIVVQRWRGVERWVVGERLCTRTHTHTQG